MAERKGTSGGFTRRKHITKSSFDPDSEYIRLATEEYLKRGGIIEKKALGETDFYNLLSAGIDKEFDE